MTLIMIAAAALAAAQPAPPAGDWASLGEDGSARYTYDRGGARREGNIVTFSIFAQALQPGGSQYSAFLARHSIDCSNGRMLLLGLRGYDAQGNVLIENDYPVAERVNVPMTPGSPQDRARTILCGAQ